ncbi:MAG: SsrA-binding protein SmpB [bacterium]|nr:SsrA-binding protein SmpB [bacterium]
MEKIACLNKKAYHEYEIIETYEAGVSLLGTEVKSLRNGNTDLKDSFARVEEGEIFVYNWHISPYRFGNQFNHPPKRRKKLLLTRREINRLYGKVKEKGLSIIPLKVYFKKGKAKLEISLAKGKKVRDIREELKRREAVREMKKAIKDWKLGR